MHDSHEIEEKIKIHHFSASVGKPFVAFRHPRCGDPGIYLFEHGQWGGREYDSDHCCDRVASLVCHPVSDVECVLLECDDCHRSRKNDAAQGAA